MNKLILSFVFLSAAVLIIGCTHHREKNWKGGIIKNYGEYQVDGIGYIIKIDQKDGLLDYGITDSTGKALLLPSTIRHPSVYQNWAVYFDKQRNFWIESSDIGTMMWKYSIPDQYQEIDVYKDPTILQQEPEEIKRRR